MKKGLYILLFIIFSFVGLGFIKAYDVDVYLFHSSTCPHCKEEIKYLTQLEKKYDYLTIHYYEVHENVFVTSKVINKLNINNNAVPITIIGSDFIIGFSDYTKSDIKQLISKYHNNKGCNAVDKIINNESIATCIKKNQKLDKKSNIKNLPFIGKVNVKQVSIPLVSMIIGLVDGFNPCAMWVLLFLISLLIGMKNRKRMWILGLTFIISSALVYLLFMLVYLNIATVLIQTWFKYIIAIVALIGGVINLNSYFKSRKKDVGCTVTDMQKRRKISNKIRKILSENSFIISLVGIVCLAFSVNLIELACSAGLPVLFTQILAMNNLSCLESGVYLFIYLFFFMLDDLIIFLIAMITFKVTGISNKYSKYSHLIGGIIMLIIGLLMAFKPEWLMFNF